MAGAVPTRSAADSASRMSIAISRSTSIDSRTRFAFLAAGWDGDPDLADLPVVLDPGRFLLGSEGVVLAHVEDRTMAILDGGIHTALRPGLVGRGHRLQLLASEPRATGEVIVAGPLMSHQSRTVNSAAALARTSPPSARATTTAEAADHACGRHAAG